jgi:hypothetical protein
MVTLGKSALTSAFKAATSVVEEEVAAPTDEG